MKTLKAFALLFVLTALPVSAELVTDPVTGLRTGTITVNGQTYEIGPFADLNEADLSDANLEGADLTEAKLEGADLTPDVTTSGQFINVQRLWTPVNGYSDMSSTSLKVVVVDFGVKKNILRNLADVGISAEVVG